MHSYLVTATNPAGKRTTFARTAASVEHARNVLERLGFTEIEFLDDEFTAALRDTRPEPGIPRTQAEFRLEAKVQRGASAPRLWLAAARNNLWLLAGSVVAIAAGLALGWWWLTAMAIVVPVAWVSLVAIGMRQVEAYNALLAAYAEGDWTAVRQRIAQLRGRSPAPDLAADLTFREAGMLAREGRLDAALQLVEPLRPACPLPGMYAGRVCNVYYAADRTEDFLAWIEQAWNESGKGSMQQLDLAFAHARVGDHARVAVLLSAFDVRNLTPLQAGVFDAAHGIRHYRRGDVDAALEPLERAVMTYAPYAGNPATWPMQGIIAGHYALALAAAGRLDEGRVALGRWERIAPLWLDPDARASLQRLFQN